MCESIHEVGEIFAAPDNDVDGDILRRRQNKTFMGEYNMDYDVIIIGGGIGGASAGAILATAGKKVLLLEREKIPAGRMTDISFKGHTINAGGHFLGEPDDIIGKIYEYAGIKLEYTSEIGESPIYRDGKWSQGRGCFDMDKE